MLPNLRAAEPDFLPLLRLEFSGPDSGLAARAFATVAQGLERPLLVVDVAAAVESGRAWPLVVDCALRDARFGGGLVMFVNVGALHEEGGSARRFDFLLQRLAAFPHPAAIEVGAPSAEQGHAGAGWIRFSLGAPTIAMRERLWAALLAAERNGVAQPDALARDLANAFQLTDSQIRQAWHGAEGLARRRNVFIASVEPDDLFAACRAQSTRRLVSFAQRIEPQRNLELDRDIVLPEVNKRPLAELRTRIRNHAFVHGAMGLGEHMRQGRGVTALFVGGSGTGKTFAAQVLASEQQIDLYRIDLASLVSKWVGETEKNLSRIFADAERANCMLFFDEADAMFGQRGEIKEARDRWANLEVNYLLQRIEDYSGVVILATNLRQNIDDAFLRRIHVVVDFPMPDAGSRRGIWQRMLPGEQHSAVSDEDLDEISERFALSGGSIRNIVFDACFRALAGPDRRVTAQHLVSSTAREYQKILRPVTLGEFGPRFYKWALADVVAPTHAPARAEA
jgi:AAA+ superfamily predicted ATPase